MTIPRATYRLQFHKGFTFGDGALLADYLAALGISHVYASPILTARAGSLHGYDVVDHSRINPELGGEEGFRAMAAALRTKGLGIIVDIVPNHMAVGQADNGWWLDLLENGRDSIHAETFDLDWKAPGLEDKILAPFLDGTPEALWAKGDLKLVREDDKWAFAYFGHRFPLRPQDQELIQAPADWESAAQLLTRQHFVLTDWRQANSRINWRRFFDVTDLAAIRGGVPAVFEAVHAKILALYAEGLIDGVRVDHVDGLADPRAYCRLLYQRLSALRPDPYLLVEKILAEDERLPGDWPVHGTTGYEIMYDLSGLLHADDGGALEVLWQETGRRGKSFEQEETEARAELLATSFAAQRDTTLRALAAAGHAKPQALRPGLEQTIAALRCYRGYVTGQPDSPAISAPLADALINDRATGLRPLFDVRDGNTTTVDALRQFHQLTAPIAAKAVEDTVFYRYGRLLSRNDVGFNPRRTFLLPQDFHDRILARIRDFPHAMLTTATHDHKRGEDTRARLAALSTCPAQWQNFVQAAPGDDRLHPADTYVLHQALFGAWPENADEAFAVRMEGWCRKHLREAKLRSSWHTPDTSYEDAFCRFARDLILNPAMQYFRDRLAALLTALGPVARANILVQAALRYTLPGVPDLYQGTEFLDLSLVDPDNRRPVDYAVRRTALAAVPAADAPLGLHKQRLIATLLAARRADPELWALGDYEPIILGEGLIAFARRYQNRILRMIARCNGGKKSDAILVLENTNREILTGRTIPAGPVAIANLLQEWPIAILAKA